MSRVPARRLSEEERGIALVMALGIMMVLAIAAAAMLEYTSTGSRNASYGNASSGSFSLAEAGVNSAMSVLANPANDPTNGSLLPSSGSPRTDTYQTGSVTWYGSYNSGTRIWTITSTGSVANPTGASNVRRVITQTATLTAQATTPVSGGSWDYIQVKRTGNPCDMNVVNGAVLSSPLLVRGNFCLDNGTVVNAGPVHVGGQATLIKSTNRIGSSGSPISEAHVANGCTWQGGPLTNPCSSLTNVFANTIDSSPNLSTPAPTADFAGWYQSAALGPAHNCTSQSGTPPSFDNNYPARDNNMYQSTAFNLTPAASYTCSSWNGTLSWDNTTRTLTVNGTIYIDGNVRVANSSPATYNGFGTLYVSGTFAMGNNSKLCGVVSGTNCNWSGWNPNTELFLIAADGASATTDVSLAQSTQFQGGLYATDTIDLANAAHTDGPMVANNITIGNGVITDPFQNIPNPPWGAPGNQVAYAKITPGQFQG